MTIPGEFAECRREPATVRGFDRAQVVCDLMEHHELAGGPPLGSVRHRDSRCTGTDFVVRGRDAAPPLRTSTPDTGHRCATAGIASTRST